MSSPASASLDTHSRLCASLSTQLPRGSVSVTPLSQPVCVVRHSPAAAVPALAAALTDAAACLSGTLVPGTAANCRLTNCLSIYHSLVLLLPTPLSRTLPLRTLFSFSLSFRVFLFPYRPIFVSVMLLLSCPPCVLRSLGLTPKIGCFSHTRFSLTFSPLSLSLLAFSLLALSPSLALARFSLSRFLCFMLLF